MVNRQALLALIDEAARDPSGARRLLEIADAMLAEQQRRGDAAHPPGYIYSGAHTWIAPFEVVDPEPLPDPDDASTLELTATANAPQGIEVPFDALILGVSGWATPAVPRELDTADKNGVLELDADPDGRDLFSVSWQLNGNRQFVTDGRTDLLMPAPAILGTRRNPRQLGWLVQRDDLIDVRVRNLSNVAVPFQFYEQQTEPYGYPINVVVEFHALNLEEP